MFKQYNIRNYHFTLVINTLLLTIFGIVMIGSAKQSVQGKQIMGLVLGTILMISISLMDYTVLMQLRWVFYLGTVGLLLLVEFAGSDSHGAQRWISIAGIKFQPSELAKIMVIFFFAGFFMKYREKLNTVKTLALAFALAAVPMGLVLIQPDTSTTIVLIFIFTVLLYLAGLSYKIILSVIGVCVPVALIGIVYLFRNAQDLIAKGYYQVKRIMSWLDPTNPLYSDYATQQQNSIMAIASGRILGKGINNTDPTTLKNSNYIIEPQTDFIFSVTAEETGFAGCMIMIVLLLLIVLECILIGRKAKDFSGQLICCGMASLIAFQAFVNLSVVTGLMPNTGVTLPFVSYGLTSLVSLYIGLGFVLNVGLQPRKMNGGSFL